MTIGRFTERLARLDKAVDGMGAEPYIFEPMLPGGEFKKRRPDPNRPTVEGSGYFARGRSGSQHLGGPGHHIWSTNQRDLGKTALYIDKSTVPADFMAAKDDKVTLPASGLVMVVESFDRTYPGRYVLELSEIAK